MSCYVGPSALGCATQLKLRFQDEADAKVSRVIDWARERGSDREVTYWSAVLECMKEKARCKEPEPALESTKTGSEPVGRSVFSQPTARQWLKRVEPSSA